MGLRLSKVSLGDALIIGLSSSGPSQTIAVSLAGLVSVSGYGGIIAILICFLPMIGIAISYQRLNRWDQSAGATYTWVAKVFHPYLGFLCGWMILLYYTLGTTTLTIPAGIYTLELVAPRYVDHHGAIFAVGAAWNVLITAIAVLGLRAVARAEWLVVMFEYVVLLTVAAVAIMALFHGQAAAAFSWQWFSWDGIGRMKGLMGGILIACFMYSGWDAAVYVNEETHDRVNSPGKAVLASVVMLALVYSITTFAFQAVLSPADLQAHAGNALSAIGVRLLHKPWDAVVALVVLTGTLASLQSAVVAASRMGFAMSRDRVMPRYFRLRRAGDGTPWAATLTMCALNLVLLALALGTGSIGEALSNAASSLGLISIVFYGITAAAALWQQRATLTASWSHGLLGGVLPAIGVLFSIWVLAESLYSGAVTPIVLGYGLGSIGIGAVAAIFLRRGAAVQFFERTSRP
jgi:amino acid transporter